MLRLLAWVRECGRGEGEGVSRSKNTFHSISKPLSCSLGDSRTQPRDDKTKPLQAQERQVTLCMAGNPNDSVSP